MNKIFVLLAAAALAVSASSRSSAVEKVRKIGGWPDAFPDASGPCRAELDDSFVPVNPSVAAAAALDAGVQRRFVTGSDGTRGTRFATGFNEAGWFVRIECDEPLLEEMKGSDRTGERLEVFFAPGADAPYHHLSIALDGQVVEEVPLLEPGRAPFPVAPFIRCKTAVVGNQWRVCFVIPFHAFSASAPVNGEETWLFNIVRWMPYSKSGAVSWCGGVDDRSSWGSLSWPAMSNRNQVRRKIIEDAWKRASGQMFEMGVYWNLRGVDPEFYAKAIEPLWNSLTDHRAFNPADRHLKDLKKLDDPKALLEEFYGKSGKPDVPAEPSLDNLFGETPALSPAGLEDPVKLAEAILDDLYAMVPDWMEFSKKVDELRRDWLLDQMVYPLGDEDAAAGAGWQDGTCYVVPPLSPFMRLPDAPPADGRIGSRLRLVAAPGEYEPASFVIGANGAIGKLEVKAAALKSDSGSIPAENVDIKVVKRWYQSGTAWQSLRQALGQRVLTPELLLNDEDLIRVDQAGQANHLRVEKPGGAGYVNISLPEPSGDRKELYPEIAAVRDAPMLMPVSIEAGKFKQFWVTVKIPADARAGLYSGKLMLLADGKALPPISLAVRVLPLPLPEPMTCYDIHRPFHASFIGGGVPRGAGQSAPTRVSRTDAQLLAEYANRLAHNESLPVFAGDSSDIEQVRKVIGLRKRAGLHNRPMLGLGLAYDPELIARPGEPGQQEFADFRKQRVEPLLDAIQQACGHRDLYFMGLREASPVELARQRPFWDAVLDAGGKVFASGWNENLRVCGDIQDWHNRAGMPDRIEAARWHRVGGIITMYAAPYGGVENPALVRRNHGMVPYKAHFDGFVNDGYWTELPWSEFNPGPCRPGCMVYPSADGVIDTIAWEGLREGIDDVRYATLVKQLAWKALATGGREAAIAARTALHWLEIADELEGDLDAMRLEMARMILELDELMKPGAWQQ